MSYIHHGLPRFLLCLLLITGHSLSHFDLESGHLVDLQLGNVAVALFFVLSGYLMKLSIDSTYYRRPGAFLINRYIKIVPPWILAITLSYIIHLVIFRHLQVNQLDGVTLDDQILNPVNYSLAVTRALFPFEYLFGRYIFNIDYSPATNLFARNHWSLLVEFCFYYYVFLVCYIQKQTGNTYSLHKPLLAAFCLVPFAYTSVTYYAGVLEISRTSIVTWAPQFAVGMIVASKNLPHVHLLRAVTMGFALVQFFLYTKSIPSLGLYSFLFVIGIQYVRVGVERHFLSKRLDQHLGNLAYPMFLTHFTVANLLLALDMLRFTGARVLDLLFYLTFVALFCWILFMPLEALLNGTRERIRTRKF